MTSRNGQRVQHGNDTIESLHYTLNRANGMPRRRESVRNVALIGYEIMCRCAVRVKWREGAFAQQRLPLILPD